MEERNSYLKSKEIEERESQMQTKLNMSINSDYGDALSKTTSVLHRPKSSENVFR
jgi:hypothetical protein